LLRKFMVSFDEEVFRELDAKTETLASNHFLRAVVVPEWIRNGHRTTINRTAIRETSVFARTAPGAFLSGKISVA
jgi:hypothetical protein